jgi:hypothetical protein
VATPGDDLVQINGDEIRVGMKNEKPTTAHGYAVARLGLAGAKEWRVAFDVCFAHPRSQGSGVLLRTGGKRMAGVWTDMFSNGLSGAIGVEGGIGTWPYSREWQHIELTCRSGALVVTASGAVVGIGAAFAAPEDVLVGVDGIAAAAGHVGDVTMRGLQAAVLAHDPEGSARGMRFADDFTSKEHTRSAWEITPNAGTVDFGADGLRLRCDGALFPVMKTKPLQMPANKPWTFSCVYRWSRVAPYGTEIRLIPSSVDPPVICIHQDTNRQYLLLGSTSLWAVPADTRWRVLSAVRNGAEWTAFIDGVRVGTVKVEAEPTGVFLGGGGADRPGAWSDIEIRRIQITEGVSVLDASALPVPLTPPGAQSPLASAGRPAMPPSTGNEIADLRRDAGILGRASRVRDGEVGRIRGLAVLTTRVDGVLVSATGVPLTVEATVTGGTGRERFLAYASEDSRVAAQRAITYAKRKIEELGYRPAWSEHDLTISFAENELLNQGRSAGVAEATALISAILGLKVDRSVAVTGCVGLNGQVDKVGGVLFKAEAAFKDPAIQTLIVPADISSTADILRLYRAWPEAFFGRRIILASHMDQVLRQALIGYDPKLEEAEDHIRAALRCFSTGTYSAALLELDAATKLTPENTTIAWWRSAIEAARAAGSDGR